MVALLPVDGDVAALAPRWLSMNRSDCTNMPPDPQARIVNPAIVRLQHFHDGLHDRTGREELTAAPALPRPQTG